MRTIPAGSEGTSGVDTEAIHATSELPLQRGLCNAPHSLYKLQASHRNADSLYQNAPEEHMLPRTVVVEFKAVVVFVVVVVACGSAVVSGVDVVCSSWVVTAMLLLLTGDVDVAVMVLVVTVEDISVDVDMAVALVLLSEEASVKFENEALSVSSLCRSAAELFIFKTIEKRKAK